METVYEHFAISYNKSRVRPSKLTILSVLFFFLWEMPCNTQYKDIGTIFHKLHSGYFIFYNRKKNLLKTQISKIVRKQQQ